jgi:hypothetical protein
MNLLDTTTLHRLAHWDSPHRNARELVYEVATGSHKNNGPLLPGASMMLDILVPLNDGPWRDNEHRTEVIRPYLRKMLALDPSRDADRARAVANHAVQVIAEETPNIDVFRNANKAAHYASLAPVADCAAIAAGYAGRAALAAAVAASDKTAAIESCTIALLDLICGT